jgi:hypothetical protein
MKQVILIFLLCISGNLLSQNKFSINGIVKTDSKEMISVSDVLLYQKNKIIAYTVIVDGTFSFESILKGFYHLKVLCTGYEPYESELKLNKNKTIEIFIKESSIALDGVVIKSTKKILENRSGNITANVEGTILSMETNTVELLSKLPKIQISPNGEQVSILGKGTPLIYIGGQRVSVEELQTLQVDEIKTIEIINNPSVKYEAEGRAILLITKRRSDQEGRELFVTERASSKTYFNNYLAANLTAKKKGVEFKLNASYNQLKIWEKNSAVYEVLDENIFSDYEVEAVTTRPQYIFGGGLYYSINDTDYISFNSRYRTQKEPFTIDTNTFLDENGTQQNISTRSTNVGERKFLSSNVNYFKSLSKNKNLFLGGQYTNYTRDVENSIQNTVENSSLLDAVEISQDFNVESFVFKGDYEIKFTNKNALELGFNYARSNSKSLLAINDDSSRYKYTEAVNGLYTQFSGGKQKMKYSFGLRVENTSIEGGFKENNTLLVNRKNTFFFPRASIDFTFSDEKSINLSLVSSIARPNYSAAVTTTAFINPALEFQGNINLTPTITNEVSSNIQLKDKSVTLRYYQSKNPVNYRFFYDDERDLTVMSPANFDEEVGLVLDVSLPFKHQFWTSTNTVSLNYTSVNDSKIVKKKSTPYMYFYTNQQFKINNFSSFNLNGWALTNRKDGIFNRKSVFTINAAYTTKFFSKLDVTINANDIFNTMEFRENYILQNLNVSNLFFTDANEFSIVLRYVFGSLKNSNYKNKSVDNELNRMN